MATPLASASGSRQQGLTGARQHAVNDRCADVGLDQLRQTGQARAAQNNGVCPEVLNRSLTCCCQQGPRCHRVSSELGAGRRDGVNASKLVDVTQHLGQARQQLRREKIPMSLRRTDTAVYVTLNNAADSNRALPLLRRICEIDSLNEDSRAELVRFELEAGDRAALTAALEKVLTQARPPRALLEEVLLRLQRPADNELIARLRSALQSSAATP